MGPFENFQMPICRDVYHIWRVAEININKIWYHGFWFFFLLKLTFLDIVNLWPVPPVEKSIPGQTLTYWQPGQPGPGPDWQIAKSDCRATITQAGRYGAAATGQHNQVVLVPKNAIGSPTCRSVEITIMHFATTWRHKMYSRCSLIARRVGRQ